MRSVWQPGVDLVAAIAFLTWCLASAGASLAAERATPEIEATAHFQVRGSVYEDRDLSGIAMASPDYGLVAADEGAMVQTFRLDRATRTMRITGDVPLLQPGDDADAEFDLEGVAYWDRAYYLVGSHGVAKKTGEVQPSRHGLLRIPVDPTTGKPVENYTAGDLSTSRTSLTHLFKADSVLSRYVDRPLQQRGLNVEGLAIRDDRMFVGLRGPNLSGFGFVLSADVEGAFDGRGLANAALQPVMLGTGFGIRDLAAVDDGFLMLLGNSTAEPAGDFDSALDYDSRRPYEIAFWDGANRHPIRLGRISDAPGKAEALLVLEEHDLSYEALILFDGANRGRPSLYQVAKPEP